MNREELIAKYSEPSNILEWGCVRVIDVMGDDAAIARSARVSYGEGTKTINENRGLIRYLMRHGHTTPFEMCEIKMHIKCPLFVCRQWMRHRSWSYNEISARYSKMPQEIYLPAPMRVQVQAKDNKQGSGAELSPKDTVEVRGAIDRINQESFTTYETLVEEHDVARELARTVLPVGMYTEFYAKVDLHNLLHFLRLRMDSHAQYEIRVYANAIAEIVKDWVPAAWEAFTDYRLEAGSFSKQEMQLIQHFMCNPRSYHKLCGDDREARRELLDEFDIGSKRERGVFLHKIGIL